MSITGAGDGPPYRLGVAIADIVSGMFAAQGITAALFARERTGRGQAVDIAMLDSVAALLTYQAGIYFATGAAPPRLGNRHPTIAPYETFTASDGDFVLAAGNDELWRRFCAVADLELGERFATNRQRVSLYDELRPILADRLKTRSRAAWIEALTAAGVPCGSVRDLGELFSDPQIAARHMTEEVLHAAIGPLRVLGTPLKLSDTPASVRTAPPTLGQHTRGDPDRRPAVHAGGRRGAARQRNYLMDISDVKRRVVEAIDRAKRATQERRVRADEAAKEFDLFLDRIAVPLCKQLASALKAEGYSFVTFSPSGAVRLASERSPEDYVELTLDTQGDEPLVIGHTRRGRGRRIIETERPLRHCPVRDITEDDVLNFLLKELEPFVER